MHLETVGVLLCRSLAFQKIFTDTLQCNLSQCVRRGYIFCNEHFYISVLTVVRVLRVRIKMYYYIRMLYPFSTQEAVSSHIGAG